jgi:hypothetical protein
MYRRRVACRIALRLSRQNACLGAVNAPSVETKVLHFPVHPFPVHGWAARTDSGSWLVVGVERPAIIGRWGREWSPAGVWLLPPRSAARRVARSVAPAVTPVITSSLVTKEKEKDRMKYDG